MKSNLTYKDVLTQAVLFLEEQKDLELDCDAPIALIQGYHHWSAQELWQNETKVMPKEEQEWLKEALQKVQDYYPVGYILGYQSFYGREFLVNESVLIPRWETEWIVEQILQREPNQKQQVVDLGCGSGCIGITLKKERPSFIVQELDISKEALAITKENAERLEAKVECVCSDVFSNYHGAPIDLFVSNPPYIGVEEKEVMNEGVKRFEPELALYAHHQGYAIYEKIAQELPNYLAENGRAYLEIGYQQGQKVKTLFQNAFPKHQVEVLKDWSGNDRLLIVEGK